MIRFFFCLFPVNRKNWSMKLKRKQAKWHGKRKWQILRESKCGSILHFQHSWSWHRTKRSFVYNIYFIAYQSYPEARRKVEGHFQDSRWYHPECVSATRHGEKESHPAHQGSLQDWPERQPPLAGAGATTHTRSVSHFLYALILEPLVKLTFRLTGVSMNLFVSKHSKTLTLLRLKRMQ